VIDQYLKVLNQDLKFYKDNIKEVADDIISEGFSQYPIFIASVFHNELGELVLDGQELGRTFSIMASTLEQMTEKKIIPTDKIPFFKESFKNPKEFACVLMLTTKTQQFIFYPYKENTLKVVPTND
jgi:hypothetical protein